jgi:hypothetical protein
MHERFRGNIINLFKKASLSNLVTLRDNVQRNFIWTLRDMKNIDAKDLIKNKLKKNTESSTLKTLVEFVKKDNDVVSLDI